MVVAVAVVAVGGWLGWLGWHEQKHEVPGSTAVEGPYEPWQVVALAITLATAVAVAAWLGIGMYAVLTASVATTVMFSVDASTQQTIGANLWPAGAVFPADRGPRRPRGGRPARGRHPARRSPVRGSLALQRS
ncbi:MAG: hypothetical protein QOK15_2037 [Nocardioidaceae bacterium]|jgi:hypothetical protein|nr:hypothetical protein [Nocardioidaceae bacterium]